MKKKTLYGVTEIPKNCKECPAFSQTPYSCHNERGMEAHCSLGFMTGDMRDFSGRTRYEGCRIETEVELKGLNKTLDVLDSMEEIRQKASEKPEDYPVDTTIRLLQAIVAEAFGYEDRSDWTTDLKRSPASRYYQRINGDNFHI